MSIYKDRVEIDNPGGLFGRMKVNDLFGRSLPRNPLLFGLMQRMNLVEKIGSGLMRIQNAVKEYGLPDMELEADGNWFRIIFKRKRANTDQEQEGGEGGMKGGTESGTKSGMNKIDISDRQKEVLHIIEENPRITIDEISKIMKINRSAVQKHIEKLKEKDVITRIGSQKSGYWEILK
ncbi:MAG: winged helix-turn-helix transcriptional regulator [Bacteroidales bacterium]|nr:winged helix-turn-helix transcriptional regulator [Bacteroidales bacterium]